MTVVATAIFSGVAVLSVGAALLRRRQSQVKVSGDHPRYDFADGQLAARLHQRRTPALLVDADNCPLRSDWLYFNADLGDTRDPDLDRIGRPPARSEVPRSAVPVR